MNLVFKVIHGPKAKAIKHVKHVKRICNCSFYLFIESLKTLIFLPVLTETSICSYQCTDHAQLLCFCFLNFFTGDGGSAKYETIYMVHTKHF